MNMVVQASSAGYDAGNYAKITINDIPLDIKPNDNGHFRGLHIVVINPHTGTIETQKAFDTWKGPEEFDNFIFDTEIQSQLGYIFIAACKDECIRALSDEAK